MPKKSKPESEVEQSERFQKEAQKLIDAGALDPIAGEALLSEILRRQGDAHK